MEKFENVTYFNHPLIQHKISILRKKETGTNEFRHLVEEIAMHEGLKPSMSCLWKKLKSKHRLKNARHQ